ncbi:MAG: hypothetical protein MJA27_27990, partial [Pseudanabaenales cyanobacterium]|nr:hypothetical protein [Pseudanabaenales cyanobacterium]
MINQPDKRALQVSLAVWLALWPIILIKPVSAQIEMQASVTPISTSVSDRPIRRRESSGTVVILPASYNPEETYPALILLPWTGGTSVGIFDRYFAAQYEVRTTNPFIAILPNVSSSSAAYASSGAWNATIA